MPIHPVLLAGGAGTRLWPVSRDALPKQFLPLVGDRTTYQQALDRVTGEGFSRPMVVTGSDFRFFARRQAEEIGLDPLVVIEPMRRDSGAAIAAAAVLARRADPNAVVLALAADHVIFDREAFQATCAEGLAAAEQGFIVTFGIRPNEPKTSYGYILRGEAIGGAGHEAIGGAGHKVPGGGVSKVKAFVEKPDPQTAARYVADGYLWNSGNFLFRADALLEELGKFEPEMLAAVEASVEAAADDLGFLRLDPAAFGRSPQKSIDYAVMERTARAAVLEGHFRWSDVGSWDALFDIGQHDGSGNVLRGPVVSTDTENCVIHAEDRLVATLGIKDLVVVATPDAVLVAPRARAQDVRQLVDKLKGAKRKEAVDHRRVHRPWGYYDSVDMGERFQVKRIVVVPGGTLSLQKHLHRSEHWVVVHGTAEVTIGEVRKLVHENESIYVPTGTVHRLANQGKIPLEIVEVQTGSYLGEDDIIRIEDVYRRE